MSDKEEPETPLWVFMWALLTALFWSGLFMLFAVFLLSIIFGPIVFVVVPLVIVCGVVALIVASVRGRT